ncbi:MAG: hypothetical protein HAW58_06320 [Candidatus Thioglobus sp.]|nr:hypothetical protein [Candidatus Thioglobus sp.]
MNDQDLLRYSRQIMLPEVGIEGQQSLLDSTVLLIGVGGLGSAAALYLAAAGVGHLIIADFDRVELSNLQRQIAHHSSNIGDFKVDSAKAKMLAISACDSFSAKILIKTFIALTVCFCAD